MARRCRERSLALVATRRLLERVWNVCGDELAPFLLSLDSSGGEEPQPILQHRTTDRVLVRRDELAHAGFLVRRIGGDGGVLVWRQRTPTVVVERLAERSGELVPPRLRDHVDDAATETAVLSRHASRGDVRLLNRVFDVQVIRLATDVLVDRHAVDQKQVFVRYRTRNRVRAPWTGRVHGGSQQQVRIDVPVRWQRSDEILLEVRGDLRRLRQHVGRASDNEHRLGECRGTHGDIERQRLCRCEGDRPLLLLESAELERDRIDPGRKRREDVVAVAGRRGGEDALTTRRGGIHGDARQHEPLSVDDLP